jgi:Flp pilus assembly protein TadG
LERACRHHRLLGLLFSPAGFASCCRSPALEKGGHFWKEGNPVSLAPPARKDRRRRGAATAELAICLPFMMFVLLVSVDYCRIFYYTITLENAARAGALYGSYNSANAQDTTGITNAALADLSNINSNGVSVAQGTDANGNPTVAVTVTHTFKTITNYPVISTNINLSRTCTMRVLPN